MASPKLDMDAPAVAALLAAHFAEPVADVEPLDGGNFSRAFAFRWRDSAYVARLGTHREQYDKDRFISEAFAERSGPVPRVIAVEAMAGGFFAVSERAAGTTLDKVPANEREAVLPALVATLDAIHRTDVRGYGGYGYLDARGAGVFATWRQFLVGMFDETRPDYWQGWRSLFGTSLLERDLFERGYARMMSLLPYCPEEHALLHGDFTFDNILSDGTAITGVIDWQGLYGDPLYDVANLDVWHGLHDFATRFAAHYTMQGREMPHYAARVACYGLAKRLDAMRFFARLDDPGAYDFIRAQVLAQLDGE